jgi:hypothetical protein
MVGGAAAALVLTVGLATPAWAGNGEHVKSDSGSRTQTDPGVEVLGGGASRSNSDSLPFTGGDVIAIAGIGVVAIGSGALAVSASRRRTRPA